MNQYSERLGKLYHSDVEIMEEKEKVMYNSIVLNDSTSASIRNT